MHFIKVIVASNVIDCYLMSVLDLLSSILSLNAALSVILVFSMLHNFIIFLVGFKIGFSICKQQNSIFTINVMTALII